MTYTGQRVPNVDLTQAVRLPSSRLVAVPVASIAYANAELAANAPGIQATASGAATALFDLDITEALGLDAGLGGQPTDVVFAYRVGVVDLSAAPTVALAAVALGAVGATEGTPTVTAVPTSTSPATLPLTANASGKVYTVQAIVTTPARSNADVTHAVLRLSFPMANTGTLLLLGGFVHRIWRNANP